ncbi:MAG: hypothetical protein AAF483_01985 [Planctomycetota bacterium]
MSPIDLELYFGCLRESPKAGDSKLDLAFGDLSISVSAAAAICEHLEAAVGFAADSRPEHCSRREGTTRFSLRVVNSRDRLTDLKQILNPHLPKATRYSRRKNLFNRLSFGGWTADCFETLPVCWLTRSAHNEILIVQDDMQPIHADEARLGVIDILNRFLETHGWHTIHSGAIQVGSRTLLVMGNSGAGKTSLITRFVSSGARFLANERLFIRQSNGMLSIRTFPQPISMGIGTVLQFSGLSPLLKDPSSLASKQNRWDQFRVDTTELQVLHALPDKLKILPPEFVAALDAKDPIPTGTIDGVLVPRFNQVGRSELFPIEPGEVFNLLRTNYFPSSQDMTYPRWLPIQLPYSSNLDVESLVDAICQLPATGVAFSEDADEALLETIRQP